MFIASGNPAFRALRAGIAFLLCLALAGCRFPLVTLSPVPPPEDAVRAFFDAVCDGDWDTADALLDGRSVALRNPPEDAFSTAFLQYMQLSYHYELTDSFRKSGMEATGKVRFTSLSPDLLAGDLRAASTRIGRAYIQSQEPAHTQTTDGVCTLTEEGARAVALEALESLMTQPDAYLAARDYPVELHYDGTRWKIQLSGELFDAIVGKYTGMQPAEEEGGQNGNE